MSYAGRLKQEGAKVESSLGESVRHWVKIIRDRLAGDIAQDKGPGFNL